MRTDRITPENIAVLQPYEVFVFGSNGEGVHLGGAARIAHDKFGAKMGQSYGMQGRSFGINTMSGLELMNLHIAAFIRYAKHVPHKTFLVTEIGCGIAGHTPEQIAPLFKEAMNLPNVHLPLRFWQVLNNLEP